MRIFDLDKWSETFETLMRNKSRSFLTAFGIFWGLFMFSLLMGGGQGLESLMAKNFEGIAQNSCFLIPGQTTKTYKGLQSGRQWNLRAADAQLLKHRVKGIDLCEPVILGENPTPRYKDKTTYGTVKGVNPEYAAMENPHIIYGRFINQTDCDQGRKVCVIGMRVREELFPDTPNPCGKFIELDSIYYEVVGVSNMKSNVGTGGGNSQQTIMLPFTTAQKIYQKGDRADMLVYTAAPGHTVTEIEEAVNTVIKEEHLIAPDDDQALFSINLEKLFQVIDNLFAGIRFLVWLIGIGTLISGTIGVSNIMMVTVKERTTEIGIRRAIGARPSNILWQIMAESLVLTLLAGLSGIVISVLILQAVEIGVAAGTGVEAKFQLSFGMALSAFGVLMLLGTLAGVAPSLRALAIKPIEALTDE